MTTIHSLGFPRIGNNRELKFALEHYWRDEINEPDLLTESEQIKQINWQLQSALDYIPVGDFSLYDHVLDMSFCLGVVPSRVTDCKDTTPIEKYFLNARGQYSQDTNASQVQAGKLLKWFNTNYHYIAPEFSLGTTFNLDMTKLTDEVKQAAALGNRIKPVILGPISYLYLGHSTDNCDKLDLLKKLLPCYYQLLNTLAELNIEWVQIDEPILATDLNESWKSAFENAYHQLQSTKVKTLLTCYFGDLSDNLRLACELPVEGIHIDAVEAPQEVARMIDWLPQHKVLSLGVINGRNIWRSNISQTLDFLEPIYKKLKDRLWLAPSCSLLHVPVDIEPEDALDSSIKSWLAFAVQKINELEVLKKALIHGRASVADQISRSDIIVEQRKQHLQKSTRASKTQNFNDLSTHRLSPYADRRRAQQQNLKLPLLPTTTIGSFPQTNEIRKARRQFKQGEISSEAYTQAMKAEISHAIDQQEALDLDVLVHGEAERNDMVEYFGSQLAGFTFSQQGWVQSYGSRCVKPPIIYGDIERSQPMTLDWTLFAQSLTSKPVKGMLTGPVTLLNWSFVRDDQAISETCYQLAVAVRKEVLDLESAGIKIIQIDEAALREGLPLRRSQWDAYLDWAIRAFRIAANGVKDETQIHTHMCYSQFNDIIESIAEMDADVITIEASRSNLTLLDAFSEFHYPNDIGPGVYDIHSPNTPTQASISKQLTFMLEKLPLEQLWVNPDCGLKTRQWHEVTPALEHMVSSAKQLRKNLVTAA